MKYRTEGGLEIVIRRGPWEEDGWTEEQEWLGEVAKMVADVGYRRGYFNFSEGSRKESLDVALKTIGLVKEAFPGREMPSLEQIAALVDTGWALTPETEESMEKGKGEGEGE